MLTAHKYKAYFPGIWSEVTLEAEVYSFINNGIIIDTINN